MAITRWSSPSTFKPLEELERLRREMDRLFDNVMSRRSWLTAKVYPPINITEDKDAYYIRAELPGVKPEDIEISVEADTVIIGGERKAEDVGTNVTYHRKERETGKFKRAVRLPTQMDPDKVEAKFKNGILTVILPKSEGSKPRQIQVKAE
ncbi:MAG TPA: Hsp20/alpha crystallin family protein [Thermodesulforhabdus norvegica]|uniref:Hsp20/alpha crystallin family protein n=1 Tax=Thermodesulforhabdus norvegica TaxID=39841 RepID=A0A7C1AXA5_9BACT|nr:Hsp20/alpha crystallin family protein [Deltaproteobacteria bacterium]MBW2067808.1 Hsp20/alpha crystallin family protein [Deltaproteobacteria bacterium]HDL89328.1 Hsp20/alpha crystallin family protein [Thermodesulforhabdus norvegica]